MKYWMIGFLAVLISVLLIFSTFGGTADLKNASTTAKNERIIIIDAGHGGLTNTTH